MRRSRREAERPCFTSYLVRKRRLREAAVYMSGYTNRHKGAKSKYGVEETAGVARFALGRRKTGFDQRASSLEWTRRVFLLKIS